MRTYWLVEKTGDVTLPKSPVRSIGKSSGHSTFSVRSTYSPVSLEDAQKVKSCIPSPVVSPAPSPMSSDSDSQKQDTAKVKTVQPASTKAETSDTKQSRMNSQVDYLKPQQATKMVEKKHSIPKQESKQIASSQINSSNLKQKENITSEQDNVTMRTNDNNSRNEWRRGVEKDHKDSVHTTKQEPISGGASVLNDNTTPGRKHSLIPGNPSISNETKAKITTSVKTPSVTTPYAAANIPKAPASPPRRPKVDLLELERKLREDAESLANNGYVSLETTLHKITSAAATPKPSLSSHTNTAPPEQMNVISKYDPQPMTSNFEVSKSTSYDEKYTMKSRTCVVL